MGTPFTSIPMLLSSLVVAETDPATLSAAASHGSFGVHSSWASVHGVLHVLYNTVSSAASIVTSIVSPVVGFVKSVLSFGYTVASLGGSIVSALIKSFTFIFGAMSIMPALLVVLCTALLVFYLCRSLHFSLYSPIIYDGQNDLPFCCFCSPSILDVDTTLGTDFEKVALVPNNCTRCAWCPFLHGSTPVVFYCSSGTTDVLCTYRTLRAGKVRDVHAAMANHVDQFGNRTYKSNFLQAHMGTLSMLEEKSSFFWITPTNSYCHATPWRPVRWFTPPGLPTGVHPTLPAPPPGLNKTYGPIHKLRDVWAFIGQYGVYPTSVAVRCSWENICYLTNTTRARLGDWLFQSRHARVLATGAEPAPYMKPPRNPDGSDVTEQMATASGIATVVGPVLRINTVHDVSDKYTTATAVESRFETAPMPGQDTQAVPKTALERHQYKHNTPTAKRFRAMHECFHKEVLTTDAMNRAFDEIFGEVEFDGKKFSKFGQPEVLAMIEELRITCDKKLNNRKANGKKEQVDKDNKAVRWVVDNSLMLLVMFYSVGHVLEHLTFSSRAIFADLSIKGKDRTTVLNEFNAKHSTNIMNPDQSIHLTCGVEIDQTAMEAHERCPKTGDNSPPHFGNGAMKEVYRHFHKVAMHIGHKLDAQFANKASVKLINDQAQGLLIEITVKDKAYMPKPHSVKLQYEDMQLDSGWLLTSWTNFINELFATSSAMLENPTHLFCKDRQNNFRLNNKVCTQKHAFATTLHDEHVKMIKGAEFEPVIQQVNVKHMKVQMNGDFNFWFKSVPLYQDEAHGPNLNSPLESKTVYWNMTFEGDDGGGRASRLFSFPANREIIVKNLQDLGFCGKLETMVNGRMEIIGAHFVMRNGVTDQSKPWVPAIKRHIPKVGIHATGSPTYADSWCRHMALALNCGSHGPTLASVSFAAADMLANLISKEDKVTVKEYTESHRVIGLVGTFSVQALGEKFKSLHYTKIDVCSKVEVELIRSSTQDPNFNHNDLGKLRLMANYIQESWTKFPEAERKAKVLELLTDPGWHEAAWTFLPKTFH